MQKEVREAACDPIEFPKEVAETQTALEAANIET